MKEQTIVLIPGDDIGPSVARATQQVLMAAGAKIKWIERHADEAALEQQGEVMPPATIETILEHGVALKGPCTTPVGKGFLSPLALLMSAVMMLNDLADEKGNEGARAVIDRLA